MLSGPVHSCLKRFRSSDRKPSAKLPPRLAHSTGDDHGAFGYTVIASTPRRASVPKKEKNINHEMVYNSVATFEYCG